MDRISAMQLFRRVVETGSFSAVSRERRVSQPTVSKQIAALEEHLGTKLLSRSTRQLNLTEAGERYYQRCCQILDEVADTEAELKQQQELATGTLRVSVPIAAGRMKLLPCVWQFFEQNPDLKLDMHFNDEYVDLVKQGVDVAIRIGELSDSSLIARRIGSVPRYIVASPEYLKKHGEPETIKDLTQHNCIVYSLLATRNEWYFDTSDGREKVVVAGRFSSNSPDAIRQATLNGHGIAVILGWLVEKDIDEGRLKIILPDYEPTSLDLNAVYQQRHFMPAKVRMLLDHLQAVL